MEGCIERDIFYDDPAKLVKKGPNNLKKNALKCQKDCKRNKECSFWSFDRQNYWCSLHGGDKKTYKNVIDKRNQEIRKGIWLTGDKDCVPKDIRDNAGIGPMRKGNGKGREKRRRRRGQKNA